MFDLLPNKLFGLDVYVDNTCTRVPKLSLSLKCPCSESVRESFNKYLADSFGYMYQIYRIDNKLFEDVLNDLTSLTSRES